MHTGILTNLPTNTPDGSNFYATAKLTEGFTLFMGTELLSVSTLLTGIGFTDWSKKR